MHNTKATDWNKRVLLRDALKNQVITVIGAGHMGGALVTGLVAAGYDPLNLWVTAKTSTHLDPLHQKLSVCISQHNEIATAKASILILAVKPQILEAVLTDLSDIIQKNQPLVISLAAGTRETTLRKQLGAISIIRAMPNMPIMIHSGITALYANSFVTEQQKKMAQSIFEAVGETVWLEKEEDIDTVSAISGSGPVYSYMLMQALQTAAMAEGLPEDIAKKLVTATALGSVKMAIDTQQSMSELCKEIASPGGGTERALDALNAGGLIPLIATAIEASLKRYKELATND